MARLSGHPRPFSCSGTKDVDAWHKAGHDGGKTRHPLKSGSSLLRPYPERRVGARDGDIVGFYEALREADRAAGLDHVGLDREPLPDLGAADEIDRHADCHQRIGAAHLVAATVPHRFIDYITRDIRPTQ